LMHIYLVVLSFTCSASFFFHFLSLLYPLFGISSSFLVGMSILPCLLLYRFIIISISFHYCFFGWARINGEADRS
jgi:hypothetical protein